MSQDNSLSQVVNTPEKAKEFMKQLAIAEGKIHLLKVDSDGTMRSRPEPVAATFDKKFADEWLKEKREKWGDWAVEVETIKIIDSMEQFESLNK